MLAPAPPRCWTRSSTRKDSETLPIWPSTNCSVKVPGKVIRWSVAMEPVTTTGTGAPQGRQPVMEPTGHVNPRFPRGSAPVGVREPAEGAAERDPELSRPHHAEDDAGHRPGSHDPSAVAGRLHDAGTAEGETGQDHSG